MAANTAKVMKSAKVPFAFLGSLEIRKGSEPDRGTSLYAGAGWFEFAPKARPVFMRLSDLM